jgi:mono/diheme cytochrome c family protein
MTRGTLLVATLFMVIALGQAWVLAYQQQGESKPAAGEECEPRGAAVSVTAASREGPKKLNPFTGNAEAVQEGRGLWLKYGCQGCHGMGGGGMGPAVLDDNWKFGGDDETLFKLIKGELPQQTMPAVFGKVMTDEEIWKIIAWIRSIYKGDPGRIVW